MIKKKLGLETLLIVNYHYIGETKLDHGIHNISVNEFDKQLDQIYAHGFRYVTLSDLVKAKQYRDLSELPKKSCLITFDDGLKQSYELGYNHLCKKGITGAFFVLSKVLHLNVVMDVHKLHLIRNKVHDKDLINSLPDFATEHFQNLDSILMEKQYPWDNLAGQKIKYLCNFLLPTKERTKLLNTWLNEFLGYKEKELAQNLYMSHSQLNELGEKGMLGTHGITHEPLAQLSDLDLQNEIEGSIRTIEKVTNSKVNAISYPYGEKSAVDDRVGVHASHSGLELGFTMFRGVNTAFSLLNDSFYLKRFDTNDVFGGKSEHLYKETLNV